MHLDSRLNKNKFDLKAASPLNTLSIPTFQCSTMLINYILYKLLTLLYLIIMCVKMLHSTIVEPNMTKFGLFKGHYSEMTNSVWRIIKAIRL